MAYPQLEGMADEAVQQKINDDIVTASGRDQPFGNVGHAGAKPMGLAGGLRHYDGNGQGALSGEERQGQNAQRREGQAYSALTYSLATGERLGLDALFEDADAAVSAMEQIAEESLTEELSGYLAYSQVTPLPRDAFTLDKDGITFWYPGEQLSLLSGYSGSVPVLL